MEILDDVKTLLGIGDTLQDNIINIYIRKANMAIINWLKTDETDMATLHPDAIINEVIINMNKRGNEGLSSFGEGAVSGTYDSVGISESTKGLLPYPRIRLR